MKTCVFAGSFDPVTLGHIEVVGKGLATFDKVIIAVGTNDQKTPAFTVDERVMLIKKAFDGYVGVEVCAFSGLVVDFMKSRGVNHYIRGIRGDGDLKFELLAEKFNREHYPELVTLFIPTVGQLNGVSSTKVKELLKSGADLAGLVPENIIEDLKILYSKKR